MLYSPVRPPREVKPIIVADRLAPELLGFGREWDTHPPQHHPTLMEVDEEND
jgi:hypothetical protein